MVARAGGDGEFDARVLFGEGGEVGLQELAGRVLGGGVDGGG